MCGIAAIFAYRNDAPDVNEHELRAIRDRMADRGPDAAGEWLEPQRRVALGHRRLSIIDLSASGAQPMLLPERHLAIVFNGEIYNHRELRSRLEQNGHRFFSTSDTEVLLRLYADHGQGMLDSLRGMFAFAIWDGVRQGMFLARDPYGIKPLYLADDGKVLRAASQVKALLAGGKISTAADPAGHSGFFLWGHVPEPHTLYREIRALPAGDCIWMGADGTRWQKTFCSPVQILARAGNSPIQGRSSQAGQLLRDALRDSVRHHLIADVPVGVFLSSGLDSTTLAALAREEGGQLRTVTLGFEEFKGTPNDETLLAEMVARQLGAVHETIWVRRSDFTAHLDRLFDAMDQPTTDGANTYFISLAARRTSLKVALSGLGGDELFGGYPSFTQVPRSARLLAPCRNVPALGRTFRAVSAPLLKYFTSPKYAGLLEYGGSYAGAYLLRRGMFMPWELPEVLDADLVRAGWAELQPLLRLDETVNGLSLPHLKVSALESSWYMRNQLLRDSDWAGMAHSLEIRVPLVDTQLLGNLAPLLASTAPPSKRDLASTAQPALPAEILNRPKTGFQIPVRDWLLDSTPHSKHTFPQAQPRGLRGWACEVYSRFTQN